MRYLKARQAEWAEAAADALASIPDPDCPPGHVRLEDEVRIYIISIIIVIVIIIIRSGPASSPP